MARRKAFRRTEPPERVVRRLAAVFLLGDAARERRLSFAMLDELDGAADDATDGELDARSAFADMLERVERSKAPLTERQRGWVRSVAERCNVVDELDVNLVSRGLVPRGREVETPAVLRRENLPMKPPGRGNR